MAASYYGSQFYRSEYFASLFYRKPQDAATIRQSILNEIFKRIETQFAKLYINRKLPIKQADEYGISVNWANEQISYSRAQLKVEPQHKIILSIAVAAKAVSAAQPVWQLLDSYSAEVEELLYQDQTFGGLAIGAEINEYQLELDEQTQSTAGTITMKFFIFYNAVEGFPRSPIL
jgi:hypothetical protein